jgi:hypothetical protein
MHSIRNRYLSRVFLATTGLVVLSSLLATMAIVAEDYHFLLVSHVWNVSIKMGPRPDLGHRTHQATIINVGDNPVSLSGVKAGHLLSAVSQEVWLQGGGAEVSHFCPQGGR